MSAELATQRLRRVLELTPQPPQAPDPDAVIDASDEMLRNREIELDGLRVILEREPGLLKGNQECRQIRDEISLRDRQWSDALDWAQRELAKRRLAGQRARQAQRAYR